MVQNAVNWWAYSNNLEQMNQIVGALKEIPKLPSEIPAEGDNHALKYVEFPVEGGVLTHMDGYDHPYRGFPFFEFVDKIDLIKKISRQVQSGFFHAFMGSRLRMLLLIPLIPSARNIFYAYTYSFHRLIDRFKLLPNRYSKAVRELHRAFSVEREETEQIRNLRLMLRDIECMILEFDNAYRFRVQDLLTDLNKDALRSNPIKEISRLLDVWVSREITVEIKDSWRLLKMFTKWYLRFDRKLLNLVVSVLLEINTEETKLMVEDSYFAKQRKDYSFPIRIEEPKLN
jgi:hypothetical protein